MSFPRFLLCAALAATLALPLAAQQQEPTGFHSIACVKVNTGQGAAFREWVSGTVHKLCQQLVDSGRYASMIVLRTEMPQGTDAECDYVFVTFYKGLPPEPLSAAEVGENLQKAGLSMTAEEFFKQRVELGTLVSTNITQYQTLVGGAKKGDYLVFNSMSAPDVGACVAYEQKVWKPLAEEMVKAGESDGWALNEQVFPRGDKDKSLVSSVDLYPSWDALFKQYDSISNGWKKVHPDMDINSTMAQFGKLCTIEHTVLYKIVEVMAPGK
ncbi:MAG TPA: hypothetical protein VMV57_15755 [Terracidiphilus sp.]|nr:hypothetical protein [Terracidiphilus sp.]